MEIYADAMLPAAPYLEKGGHYTDWEGRSQRLRPVRDPRGLARSEWEIFQELSEVMGKDMGFHSLDELHEEMARLLTSSPAGAVDAATPRSLASLDRGGPPGGYAPPPQRREEQAASAEGGELLLFSYPLLVDEGSLSMGADRLKAALEDPAFVEISRSDADRLGVTEGATVRLRTPAGEAELPARVTDGIAPGCVFVPLNQPGFAANAILSGSFVTTATLESVQEPAS
jgi:NADH-quinone oxidoreductase subunit G